MNVFTGWTGWAILAALILTGWLCLGAALAAAYHLTKRAWQRHYYRHLDQVIAAEEARVYQLVAEHARLTWTDVPPCSHEDGWCVCVPEPSDPRWAQ